MRFKTTRNPTAYGYFDSDPAFQVEADSFLRYAERMLGSSVVSVELARDIYWTNLEASTVKWSNLINEYNFTSNITSLVGKPRPLQAPNAPGDKGNISGRLVSPNNDFTDLLMYSFAKSSALGGDYEPLRGIIMTEVGKQVYDLKTDLLDMRHGDEEDKANIPPLYEAPENEVGMRMRILEIYHWDNSFTTLNFRPRSAINLFVTDLQMGRLGRFNFQYVLPVFDDIVRAQHLKQTNKMRRSPFTWKIRGTKIYIYPRPTYQMRFPLFIDVAFVPGIVDNGLDGQGPIDCDKDVTASYTKAGSETTGFITDLSNVPYGLYEYSSINAIGREWIREYALALCKISLGNIRGKYGSLPVPGDSISLNGSDMVQQGQGERDALITNLRERLEALTHSAVLERRAAEAENLNKINAYTAPKKVIYIA